MVRDHDGSYCDLYQTSCSQIVLWQNGENHTKTQTMFGPNIITNYITSHKQLLCILKLSPAINTNV